CPAAHGDDGIQLSALEHALHNDACAPAHRDDRTAAIRFRHERRERHPRRARDFVADDEGSKGRLAEYSDVDYENFVSAILDLSAQETNFLSLGIERANYDDGRHGFQSPIIATARTGAAVVLTHLTGKTA